jgi:hypothetical protein
MTLPNSIKLTKRKISLSPPLLVLQIATSVCPTTLPENVSYELITFTATVLPRHLRFIVSFPLIFGGQV